jgi:hypothetical protein
MFQGTSLGGSLIWNALVSNPWAVTIVGGIAVLFVGWIFKRLFFVKELERAIATVQQTVSPSVTQNFQPTINVHTARGDTQVLPQTPEHRKSTSEDKTAAPVPRFEYKGPREKTVYINPYARYGITDPRNDEEFKSANTALCLRFENVPDSGAASRALDVIAKVSFRSANGAREQAFDYGVWLNSPCNSTDMEVGDTRELVLICVMDTGLVSFEDRREGTAASNAMGALDHKFDARWTWLDDRAVDGLESVEIKLIDRKTRIAATFKLRIWYQGGHFNCAVR